MLYRKIMVPFDDSKASLRALDKACEFATVMDAEVLVIHVVDLTQFSWAAAEFSSQADVHRKVKEIGARVLEHAARKIDQSGVRHKIKILESAGDKIANLIVDEAKDSKCELIIMGTNGFSGLMHLLIGSVAEGVFRKTPVPVLLIRHKNDDD